MPASTMARLAADAAISLFFLLLLLPTFLVVAGSEDPVQPPDEQVGARWAVLVAGSKGYENYRHQDYVGDDVTVNNFFAVILGNKSALTGGSGKVVNSGPNDHIFIYYSDHGSTGSLVMPTPPHIYAGDLMDVLKKKHASKSYKSLVVYVEACESGSIFEGLLTEGLNIYVTTASDATESSWATYCPEEGVGSRRPPEYTTCLGDLYSVSWMEDSDAHDLRKRTLKQQYKQVKNRTSVMQTYKEGSHVMQYGDLNLNSEFLISYMGSGNGTGGDSSVESSLSAVINQRDADLVHFWNKFMRSTEGSSSKIEAQKELVDVLSHRLHVDNSIELVRNILFGSGKGMEVLKAVRPAGQPLVDDWACLKTMVRTFETYCGSLNQYGLKHMRALANICNAGFRTDKMIAASSQACKEFPSNPWSSLRKGYSA